MNLHSVFEELDKLYEYVEEPVEEPAEELEVNEALTEADDVEEASIEEGIFDSKATKEKTYKAAIKEAFGKDLINVINEVCENAEQVVSDAAERAQDDTKFLKNVQAMLQTLESSVKSRKISDVISIMLSFGRNNTDGSAALDELQLAFKKSSALKNAPKVGEKAFAYFNEKLCAALVKKLSQYKNFLKQEYTESAEVTQATALTEETAAEVKDEEAVQLVLECSNCGGIKVVSEADVKVDEETDLANIGDPCQYCEEAEGYKIMGSLAPYDVAEEPAEEITDDEDAEIEVVDDEVVEEGLLDVDLPISVDVRADGNNVTVGGIS
jgi:hypothetical protein